MSGTWDDMITVGRIIRPHGHRGSVIVAPESDFAAERFEAGADLVWKRGDEVAPVRVRDGREHHGRWIVVFEGVETMNDAEALRDVELRIPAQDVRGLGPDAHYVHDLRDCVVRTTTGDVAGRVVDVQFGSGAPVLVLAGEAGDEVLVPFVDSICRSVDTAAKTIVIDPPPGLIELNRKTAR
jgi:16S rRNA processing protein RimM